MNTFKVFDEKGTPHLVIAYHVRKKDDGGVVLSVMVVNGTTEAYQTYELPFEASAYNQLLILTQGLGTMTNAFMHTLIVMLRGKGVALYIDTEQ